MLCEVLRGEKGLEWSRKSEREDASVNEGFSMQTERSRRCCMTMGGVTNEGAVMSLHRMIGELGW